MPIVLFLHNFFSHKRLEQNEAFLPHANFGFRLKNQEENGAGKICYCPIRRISHEYASHRNYSRSAGFRLHNHPVGRRTTNDVRWIGSLIVSEKQQSQCGIGLVLNSWNATQMLVTLSRACWEARIYTDSIDVFREVAVRPGHKNSAVEFIWPSIPKSSKSVDKVQDAFLLEFGHRQEANASRHDPLNGNIQNFVPFSFT